MPTSLHYQNGCVYQLPGATVSTVARHGLFKFLCENLF